MNGSKVENSSSKNISETQKRGVDIIIPVYNGFEDLQKCVDSVRMHTDLSLNRVIIIDDCSTDERVSGYLDTLLGESGIIIHKNPENMGFSSNVNKGLTSSDDRDVILLNSDTVVTGHWVEKLKRAAYASVRTATVTPLSNAATLCSTPKMCVDCDIPYGMGIDEYADLIEKVSLKVYPRISVAVGFCMYIKRSVIEEVGLFDAETFVRGYGEENDFCNRAEQFGYKHVMCDDTFIYHSGTASFQPEEKKQLIEEHDKILRQRYPVQMRKNHLYCLRNPDQYIRDNINFFTELARGKKNILFVLQADFRENAYNSIGGTQLHVKDLALELKDEFNTFVLARDKDAMWLTLYSGEEPITLAFKVGDAETFEPYHREEFAKLYREIICAIKVDLIHVHHTQQLTLDIYDVAGELNVPVILTLHDYYYACPGIKLFDYEDKYCAAGEKGCDSKDQLEICDKCLKDTCGLYTGSKYLKKWRMENKKAMSKCRKIIFPSEAARDVMLGFFPEISKKSMVIPHGCDLPKEMWAVVSIDESVYITDKMKTCLDRVLEVAIGDNDIDGWAFLAGADSNKTEAFLEVFDCNGTRECYSVKKHDRPDVAAAMNAPEAYNSGIYMRLYSENLYPGPCRIRVILKYEGRYYSDNNYYQGIFKRPTHGKGRLNVAFMGGMVPAKGSVIAREMMELDDGRINWFVFGTLGEKQFEGFKQDNVFFGGTYLKKHIRRMLKFNAIDVVCILSLWPETFCYTLSEAWICKVPVLAADIGAVGRRVKESGGGWTVPVNSTAAELVDFLHGIQDNQEELNRKKEVVSQMNMVSVKDMCADYSHLYRDVIKECPRGELPLHDREYFFDGFIHGHDNDKVLDDIQDVASADMNQLMAENEGLKNRLGDVENTMSYKAARKMSGLPVPFKKQMKKLLNK